jgi:hypothetical protein
MRILKVSRFRKTVGALAILGAILNAWVLTLHVTSTALASLRADGTSVLICHQGGTTSIVDLGTGSPAPSSKKHCPICSGLASLHLGILSAPGLIVATGVRPAMVTTDGTTARIRDRRPHQTLNRGPPVFA